MKWTIANQLTVLRMILSIIFFVLVGVATEANRQILLGTAFVLYVIACFTDLFDGYFARKLNQVSAFGRILDPVMDKILIIGAFVMLLGRYHDFPIIEGSFEASLPAWLTGGSAVTIQSWMIVVILAREFLISGIRGYSESIGKQFPAMWSGKIKMIVQCFGPGTVIFVLTWAPNCPFFVIVKIAAVWITLLITIYSGLDYIIKARKLFV